MNEYPIAGGRVDQLRLGLATLQSRCHTNLFSGPRQIFSHTKGKNSTRERKRRFLINYSPEKRKKAKRTFDDGNDKKELVLVLFKTFFNNIPNTYKQ